MVVRPRRRDSPERMIKRFNRKAKKARIVDIYKEKSRYKKPSEIRKAKKNKRLKENERQKKK